jgi:hypothetical protein
MSKTIEHEWEIELPAGTAEEILAALSARDRLFGQSITLEPEDDPAAAVEVWLGTTDALADARFHLGVYAELTGPADYLDAAVDAVEDLVSEQIEEAGQEVEAAALLARRPLEELEFRLVEEDDERPQLIIPEWLAPSEEIELPWSFRSFTREGSAWPDDAVLDAHERVALVPIAGEVLVFSLPIIEDEEE